MLSGTLLMGHSHQKERQFSPDSLSHLQPLCIPTPQPGNLLRRAGGLPRTAGAAGENGNSQKLAPSPLCIKENLHWIKSSYVNRSLPLHRNVLVIFFIYYFVPKKCGSLQYICIPYLLSVFDHFEIRQSYEICSGGPKAEGKINGG